MRQKTKQLIMTLVALLAVTAGAWADETPLVTIESNGYTSFTSGSKTFDDKVTVTFSNSVRNDGDTDGWFGDATASLLTVAGINGYTITSCKFYTASGTAANGYTVEGKSPSVCLYLLQVYTDDSKSVNIGQRGISKIEVYGTPPTPVTFTRGTGDKANEWTMDGGMPDGNVRVNVEYWPGLLTLPAASEGGTVTLERVTNTIIDENFDDYTAGGKMAETANAAGNSNWTTWTDEPGSDNDGTLATLIDNTCLKVTTGNDQVLLLGDKTSGMWEFSLDVYVPEGKFGYFNLLHDFDGEGSTWAFQCYLNAIDDGQNHSYSLGHGTVHAGSNGKADLPCVVNEWMHVRIVIDIDNDLAKLYFNDEYICEWQWSLESFGGDVGDRKLAACNIYCSDGEFYVDNIKLTQISALPAGFERDDDGNIYVESGTQFTLVTTPAENYHLASLSDGINTYDVDDDGKVTITMPDADLTLTAEFAVNTYDLTLNPANVNTIDAGMATVTVDDQSATVTDGKIEDVKMGSEVKMTTATGYKFRKVSSQAYGICVYNYDENWPLGFITFNIDDPSNVSVLNGNAGDYWGLDYCPADGYYYAYNDNNKQLFKMDLNGNIVGTVATLDTYLNDGAWNPINNTMYAVYDNNICTVNLSTGELTTLVTSENGKEFSGIACNADGQLYATMEDGNLYTVNANNGELTLVGATGYIPDYAQSLQFDKLTGNLYWCYSDEYSDHFMQVDPTTGAATMLQEYTGETTGLSFPLSLVKFSDTEAKFTMLAKDVTVNYDIVRDMEIAVNAVMPASIRIQEKQGGGYEPIDAMKMIPEVKDAIDGESQAVTMTEVTEQTAETGDYTLKLQKLVVGDVETWVDADPDNLEVGTYRYEVTGANLYGGVCYTNEFKLFECYPVTVPARGFVTYYSDENLTVDAESGAVLYTITNVSGNTATATEIASANKETPFLIYNPTDEEQTFMLIPTENQIDLSVYPGFKGTLEGKTFTAAEMADFDFYVVNNAQFVWVKDPGTIAANRCWLEKAKNSAARAITILFGDATGITAVSGSPTDNGDIYDLNGRKVQKPVKKGVYIQNGQKKVMK